MAGYELPRDGWSACSPGRRWPALSGRQQPAFPGHHRKIREPPFRIDSRHPWSASSHQPSERAVANALLTPKGGSFTGCTRILRRKEELCAAKTEKGTSVPIGTADPDTIYNPPCTSTAFAAGERSISSGQSLRALEITEFKEPSQVHVTNGISPHIYKSMGLTKGPQLQRRTRP